MRDIIQSSRGKSLQASTPTRDGPRSFLSTGTGASVPRVGQRCRRRVGPADVHAWAEEPAVRAKGLDPLCVKDDQAPANQPVTARPRHGSPETRGERAMRSPSRRGLLVLVALFSVVALMAVRAEAGAREEDGVSTGPL